MVIYGTFSMEPQTDPLETQVSEVEHGECGCSNNLQGTGFK